MTKLYDYTPSDQEYIKKLSLEYPVSIHEALDIFSIGGRKRSEYLCELKSMGKSDETINIVNRNMIEEDENKKKRK